MKTSTSAVPESMTERHSAYGRSTDSRLQASDMDLNRTVDENYHATGDSRSHDDVRGDIYNLLRSLPENGYKSNGRKE